MKKCPQCGWLCHDEASFCIECSLRRLRTPPATPDDLGWVPWVLGASCLVGIVTCIVQIVRAA